MTFYDECLAEIGAYRKFSLHESSKIISRITDEIEFTWYERIDFSKASSCQKIDFLSELKDLEERDVYVFWDYAGFNLLETQLKYILAAWDNVSLLGTRTWIISVDMDFFLEIYDDLYLGFK